MAQDSIASGAAAATETITKGLDQVWYYDNITIKVLMIGFLISIVANFGQYIYGQYRADKDFQRHNAITLAMNTMAAAIAEMSGSVREMKSVFNFVVDLYKEKQSAPKGD